jgi:hypothetical protein
VWVRAQALLVALRMKILPCPLGLAECFVRIILTLKTWSSAGVDVQALSDCERCLHIPIPQCVRSFQLPYARKQSVGPFWHLSFWEVSLFSFMLFLSLCLSSQILSLFKPRRPWAPKMRSELSFLNAWIIILFNFIHFFHLFLCPGFHLSLQWISLLVSLGHCHKSPQT